jgi:hypothetical protein
VKFENSKIYGGKCEKIPRDSKPKPAERETGEEKSEAKLILWLEHWLFWLCACAIPPPHPLTCAIGKKRVVKA